ncbi:MAG: ISNCY family transposase [Acidobacteriaceae bacterium]|nr:ISNCY family transposase [Acidobacteriaceae bacterium]
MTQKERDRLVALKKAKKKLITQKQAAAEMGVSERHVRRLLRSLKERGDKAVIHAARGRKSNRKMAEEKREQAMRILSQDVYRGFGPTLAAEYLAQKHQVRVGRETLRGWMSQARLWHPKTRRLQKVHTWRARRSRCGELVQWDTSEHDWLEGRGPKLYLISLLDDASSRLLARFVEHDSTEENMRVLATYLETYGRPLSFYTDKASLFANLPKSRRGELTAKDVLPLPPTQIGRALQELDIEWIAAQSPQAKGRIERGFGTAQDRLVKGLRVAGAKTLEQANAYLKSEFLPWWNQTLTVAPACSDDAHRPIGKQHHLSAILSHIETRQVANDYTLRFANKLYQIQRTDVRAGLRGGSVVVEKRLDGTLAVRFQERYVSVAECVPQPKAASASKPLPPKAKLPRAPNQASRRALTGMLRSRGMPLWKAAQINRTRTQ